MKRRSFNVFFDIDEWILEWVENKDTTFAIQCATYQEALLVMQKQESISWLCRIE